MYVHYRWGWGGDAKVWAPHERSPMDNTQTFTQTFIFRVEYKDIRGHMARGGF
jgi:hypothetical protein